jgi:Methyltransferase domain
LTTIRHPAPQWLLLHDIPAAAVLLQTAFGGSRWRHIVKTLAVPHLVVPGHSVVLGIAPDHGVRRWRTRMRDCLIQVTWLLGAALSPGLRGRLPWGLEPDLIVRWRLINLARSPSDRRSASVTIALCVHAVELADAAGVELQAEVDWRTPRLVRAYERAGFVVVSRDHKEVTLRRAGRLSRTPHLLPRPQWQQVIRTGRFGANAWRARFGHALSPVLDVGAGDSPLVRELLSEGTAAIALDPQFSQRPPAQPTPTSIAGLAEALPFRSNVFGTVHASYVVQHATRPAEVLAEFLRVARRDGIVVIHPLWGSHRRRRALRAIGGVSILPGRFAPPGRQRPSVRISVAEFDAANNGCTVSNALRPPQPARLAGVLAMRIAIHLRGTTSLGPGAVR